MDWRGNRLEGWGAGWRGGEQDGGVGSRMEGWGNMSIYQRSHNRECTLNQPPQTLSASGLLVLNTLLGYTYMYTALHMVLLTCVCTM